MARKIKRFLVFMFFSLFFTVPSKKIQSTDSSKANVSATLKDSKSSTSIGQVLSSVIGVKSADAAGCYTPDGGCTWVCDGPADGGC
ncbi:MAG: hypothetical protein IKS41_06440 [Alphaproteobacteria bacterium]|nr:hypothetical protein [Alphaproteobacteria bacterium]